MLKNIFLFLLLFTIQFISFSDQYHIIKEGETIYRISKLYNVNSDDLIKLNNITDINNLSVGTKIIIKKDDLTSVNIYYKVKKGDTLYSISKLNNISLAKLMDLNNLDEHSIISLDQQLVIGKKNENLTSINPGNIVIKDKVESSLLPYWPIEGNITNYSGRIQGVKIEGISGDYIQSVSNGRVIWYDSFKGIGKVVLIEGDNGYDYLYGSQDELSVKLGVQVQAGDKLGRLKDSNNSIIFSVFKNGKPLSDIAAAPR